MKKRLLFTLILALLAFLVIDTMMFVTLALINTNKAIFYDSSNVPKATIDHWVDTSFDAELGWDQPKEELSRLGSRSSKVYQPKPVYEIKAFGDSFTQGTGVKDNETWEAYIEQLTGWDCLNFGVQGYGVDQAFLKYSRLDNVKSKYTLLATHIENIGRLVSVYRAFYTGRWGPPKPYYTALNDKIELVEAPVTSQKHAYKLLDKHFVDQIRAVDYWPNYYENVRGSPSRLTWPSTWMIFKHFDFFYNRSIFEFKRKVFPSYDLELQRSKYYHLYDESSIAFTILKHIITGFIELSHERSEIPIVIIFPSQHALDVLSSYRTSLYSAFLTFLHAQDYPFLDFGSILVSEAYSQYYLSYDGHFSPEGNARIAHELLKYIENLGNDQLEGGL